MSEISDDVVRKALAVDLGIRPESLVPSDLKRHGDRIRAMLEAVWPEPMFTPDEIWLLLSPARFRMEHSYEETRAIRASGRAKLEAMRDGTL